MKINALLVFALILALAGCKSKIFRDLELIGSGTSEDDSAQSRDGGGVGEEPLPDSNSPRTESVAAVALRTESFTDDPDVKAKRAELERLADVEWEVTAKLERLRKTLADLETRERATRAELDKLNATLANRKTSLASEISQLEESQKRLEEDKDKLLTENKILLKHYEDTKTSMAEMKKNHDREERKLKELSLVLKQKSARHETDQKKWRTLRTKVAQLEVKKSELEELTPDFNELKRKLNENIQKMTLSVQGLERKRETKTAEAPIQPAKPAAETKKEKPVSSESESTPGESAAASCEVVMDSYLIESKPDENKGTAPGLVAGYSNAYKNLRGVIKFALPPDLKPDSLRKATLKCYCYTTFNSKKPQTIQVHAVNGDWDENGVSWNDVEFDSEAIAERQVDRKDVWVTWNVTPLVKRWLKDGNANHGLLLLGAMTKGDESSYYGFRSKEGESNPPVLELITQ